MRSSTKNEARPSYHHGNLREAAVATARAVVESQGIDALSVRSIGQSLGVTHSALYRHFSSRDALAAAVVSHGFDELLQGMQSAADQSAKTEEAAGAMGAYASFAIDHRNLYRLMFAYPAKTLVGEEAPGPQVRAVIALAAKAFRRDGDLPGISAALRDRVVAAWALSHGLCDLWHSGGLRARNAEAAKTYIANVLKASGLLRG
jgi:AcrR family transcriptional regulator